MLTAPLAQMENDHHPRSPKLGGGLSPRDLGDVFATVAAAGGVSLLFPEPHRPHFSPSHTPLPAISQKPKYHQRSCHPREHGNTINIRNKAQANAAELPLA